MRQSRRAYLASVAGAAALGTAGCLGGGTGQDETSTDSSNGGTDSGTNTESGKTAIPGTDCEVAPRGKVSSAPTPTLGPDDATVTVDAWEDFACPHCQTFTLEVFPQIESEYISEGIVQFRQFDFPIPVNKWWSYHGASASHQVYEEAGNEAYFSFVHTMFENQDQFGGNDVEGSLSTLESLANDADLDGCSIAAAAYNDRFRPYVESMRTEAVDENGFRGTPTVLVNGEQVTPTWSELQSAIENVR
ncbi:thioredoxin domain-containing protein [Haloferax namakaokahaiae]|uniref:Thioredoxin domain-containing protein n=1 Tax=Haloferax namakaokahaiae TaxID=1748331 RepID=A0ABD5ZFG5_9EURY